MNDAYTKGGDGDVLDFTGKDLHSIESLAKSSPNTVIYDKNCIKKIDNLDTYGSLRQLSVADNQLTHISGLAHLHCLTVLNLANNSISAIEGLRSLRKLQWLCLSGNRIENLRNLEANTGLEHLDVSDNRITTISDLSHLKSLQRLLLHGNCISSLRMVGSRLPASLRVLTLASNLISDLNEVSYLSSLSSLQELSLLNNPCLSATTDILFDYRPFVVNWCLSVKVLDGSEITQKEGLKAEWLYSQGKGRTFRTGQHKELVHYLCSQCPISHMSQADMAEEARLARVLQEQRMYQEQLYDEQFRQHLLPLASPARIISSSSRHGSAVRPASSRGHQRMSPGGREDSDSPSRLRPDSARDVSHQLSMSPRAAPFPGGWKPDANTEHQMGRYGAAPYSSDIEETASMLSCDTTYLPVSDMSLRSGIHDLSPAVGNIAGPTAAAAAVTRPQVLDNVRSSSAGKQQNRQSSSRHHRDRGYQALPSHLLVPQAGTSDLDSSDTDSPSLTSDGNSTATDLQLLKTVIANLKAKRKRERAQRASVNVARSEVRPSGGSPLSSSPQGVYIPDKYASPTRRSLRQSADNRTPRGGGSGSEHSTPDSTEKGQIETSAQLKEESLAATRVQALWRGYRARHYDVRVVNLRHEIRARRSEDHIRVLQCELDRQRTLYEQSQRLQVDALKQMWLQVQSLQKWKEDVLKSQDLISQRSSVAVSHDASHNTTLELHQLMSQLQAADQSEPVSPLHVTVTPQSSVSVTSSVQSVVQERQPVAAMFNFSGPVPQTVVASSMPQPAPASSPPRKQQQQPKPLVSPDSAGAVATGQSSSHGDQASTETAPVNALWHSNQPANSQGSASLPPTASAVSHTPAAGGRQNVDEAQPTLLLPPAGITVTSQTATSFTLSWQSPTTDVTGFLIYIDGQMYVSCDAATRVFTVKQLHTNYTYTVIMRSVCGERQSGDSETLLVTLREEGGVTTAEAGDDSDKDRDTSEDSQDFDVHQSKQEREGGASQHGGGASGSDSSGGSSGSGGEQPEGQMVHSVSSSSSVGGAGEERRTRKVSVLQQFENNLRKSGHARGFSEPCQTPAGTAEMWAIKNDVQFTIDLPSDLGSGTTRSHIPVAVKATGATGVKNTKLVDEPSATSTQVRQKPPPLVIKDVTDDGDVLPSQTSENGAMEPRPPASPRGFAPRSSIRRRRTTSENCVPTVSSVPSGVNLAVDSVKVPTATSLSPSETGGDGERGRSRQSLGGAASERRCASVDTVMRRSAVVKDKPPIPQSPRGQKCSSVDRQDQPASLAGHNPVLDGSKVPAAESNKTVSTELSRRTSASALQSPIKTDQQQSDTRRNRHRSGSELAWSALPDKQESPRQRRTSPPGNTPTQAPGSPRVKRSSSFSSKAQPNSVQSSSEVLMRQCISMEVLKAAKDREVQKLLDAGDVADGRVHNEASPPGTAVLAASVISSPGRQSVTSSPGRQSVSTSPARQAVTPSPSRQRVASSQSSSSPGDQSSISSNSTSGSPADDKLGAQSDRVSIGYESYDDDTVKGNGLKRTTSSNSVNERAIDVPADDVVSPTGKSPLRRTGSLKSDSMLMRQQDRRQAASLAGSPPTATAGDSVPRPKLTGDSGKVQPKQGKAAGLFAKLQVKLSTKK